MVQIERQSATFRVAGQTRDNIPVGDHDGYVEWTTIHLRGQPHREISKCMLHLERSHFPEFFSPNNSMTAMSVNVLSDVRAGNIQVTLG
jgi:hypothetical protein